MTKHLSINNTNILDASAEVLDHGGIIVYPTDTLYGFGVDARNKDAIDKINKIKGRNSPMSVIAADFEQLLSWALISDVEIDLVNENIGDKTTFILPAVEGIIHGSILGPDNTIGVRIPTHPFGPDLVDKLGYPITSSSVNRHGDKALNNPEMIIQEFGEEIDLIIDAGILPPSGGSTIYKIHNNLLKKIR